MEGLRVRFIKTRVNEEDFVLKEERRWGKEEWWVVGCLSASCNKEKSWEAACKIPLTMITCVNLANDISSICRVF
ncbi:hypothetical protein FRX31_004535 [Thalictrum thalictroides]|uniref:Uncharacterized protein n=1 Tax=Thalictrum thalictroides TaxID=46969 RepID=A0A7J6VW35_THATH|nr:hypothetical protein FRX31_022033 [Thalictrum thalictroides]KAF5205876.1 hypothetical protein FRX31_004535 [Thalictrum thalictroides]